MSWYTSWSYLPVNYNTTIGTIENITQRTFFRNNLNGTRVKVKFSNRYGQEPLILEKAVIGQRREGEAGITQTQVLTRQGEQAIVIGPGEEFFGDELEWKAQAGTEIVLSVYIRQRTGIRSACSTWRAKSWHTVYGENGDYTEAEDFEEKQSREIYPYVEADVNKANIVVGVSAICVFSEAQVTTVALFGDSITHMSYFADALGETLYREYPGKVTLVNRGIGGNRILHDASFVKDMPGEGACFGKAAVTRFARDCYETEHPDYILMLEGVNDMMHPEFFGNLHESVSAEELAAGVEEIVKTAHRQGSRIYLGTVMPFGNDEMPGCPRAEQVREAFNAWLRTRQPADGIFDFDVELQDADRPKYVKAGMHIGDGLHPNEAGGAAMAAVVLAERRKTDADHTDGVPGGEDKGVYRKL